MQLGWIDFSKSDREKVLDVMHLLQEQGAVDELGIGVVRDAFANRLFPGTSTVQTRAKYFLIVPYVLKEAGEGLYGDDVNKIIKRIDDEERDCGMRLLEGGKEGVIGQLNLPNSWVVRTPSNIYWNGIKSFEIFRDQDLSIREYVKESIMLRSLRNKANIGNRSEENAENEQDDKDAGDLTKVQFWDLPESYKPGWRDSLKMALLPEEGEFLRNKILSTQKDTLLGYILKNHVAVKDLTSFAEISELVHGDVSDEIRELLDLGNAFNNLVYLGRIRYNLILAGGNNEEAVDEWDKYLPEIKTMANVDLDRIFTALRINNPRAKSFLKDLKSALINGDYKLADEVIVKREVALKGPTRAKLNHREKYKDDEWVGGYWLDYRFLPAKRIIADIYASEGIDA